MVMVRSALVPPGSYKSIVSSTVPLITRSIDSVVIVSTKSSAVRSIRDVSGEAMTIAPVCRANVRSSGTMKVAANAACDAIAWYQYAANLTNNNDPGDAHKISDLRRKRSEREIADVPASVGADEKEKIAAAIA